MANRPQYNDPAEVSKVADWMMKNPGVAIDTASFPDGMLDAVSGEIGLREQHHKDVGDAMMKMKAPDAEAALKKPSIMDPDPDHSAPMAGLLGASDSLTLGHTDELAGLLGAIDGNGYAPVRDAVREKQQFARKNHPWAYGGMSALGATQLPGPKGSGVAMGAIAGEGYSNKELSDPGLASDSQAGGLIGAAAEGAINAGGHLVKRGLSELAKNMAGSFKVSPALLRYLGYDDKGITELLTREELGKGVDALPHGSEGEAAGVLDGPTASEIGERARAASEFPYLNPQKAKDAIAVPATAAGRINNDMSIPSSYDPANNMTSLEMHQAPMPVQQPKPGAWTPQVGRPQSIDFGPPSQEMSFDPASGYSEWNDSPSLWENASSEDLNGIAPAGPAAKAYNPRAMPVSPPPGPTVSRVPATDISSMPQQPPLDPVSRATAQGFGTASNRPSQGMPTTTLLGSARQMFDKNIAGPTAIGIPKAGEKLMQYLSRQGAGQTARSASLMAIVNHVMSSPDPSFSDYLAKETFPEYLAASQQADKEEK